MNFKLLMLAKLVMLAVVATTRLSAQSVADRYRADANRIIDAALSDSAAWNRLAEMTETDPEERELIKVREDVGVIIHMPVQGPQAGTVTLVHADLQAGARHAELCHAIRSRAKSKVRAFAPPEPAQAPVELKNETTEDIWRALFRGATTSDDATALWKRAKEEGVQGIFLNELISIAKEAIRQHS